jgi:hypothetical protein
MHGSYKAFICVDLLIDLVPVSAIDQLNSLFTLLSWHSLVAKENLLGIQAISTEQCF